MTRLLLVVTVLAATAAATSSGQPAVTGGGTPPRAVTPSARITGAAHAPTWRQHAYANCREHRGLEVNTDTPSRRELDACRKQRAHDARRDVRVAIRLLFPRYAWQRAIDVTWCESRWVTSAYNRSSGASGPWQIIRYWHPWYDEPRGRRDALYATRAARRILASSGWGAWECA